MIKSIKNILNKQKNKLYSLVYFAFVLFIVLPLVYTFGSAFFGENSLSENILLIDQKMLWLLAKSCFIAFSIAILSTLFGTILAVLLYKTKLRFQTFLKITLLIPLFISPYILAVAWSDIFFTFFNNSNLISSYFAVILVLTTVYTPLSMLIIGSSLSNIDAQLEESALMITNFSSVLFKIILPLIKPALISSFVLVFIFSISEFSVPAFFNVKVFTTEIFIQFSAFYNHSLAILQSTFLIFICVFLLYLDQKSILDTSFLSVSNKGTITKLYSIRKYSFLAYLFLIIWFFLNLIFPFIILIIQSFKNGSNSFAKALELLLPTFSTSILLALSSALIIVFIGFVVAHQSFLQKGSSRSFDWILLLVFAIPSSIFGISLIQFYNHTALNFIYSSYAILLIAYVGKFSFISSRLISNALKQIPNSLDELAQTQGIKLSSRVFKIIIPLIFPALFAAFVISFIFSFGELGTSIMLYPPGAEILPIKVFTIMANASQSLTSSMSLIVFSITLLLIIVLYLIMNIFRKSFSVQNRNFDHD